MATSDKQTQKAPGGDAGQAEVQAKMDVIEEQGFEGNRVDHTPRENYTLQTPQDAPTPETTERVAQAEELNAGKIEARKAASK